MSKTNCYADVILPLPVKGTFTYTVPEDFIPHVKPGMRAIVQFGPRKVYTSIILSVHSNSPSQYKSKEIINLPDEHPLVFPVQLNFWLWLSSYYLCSIGEVYKAALPTGLKPESETRFSLRDPIFENTELNQKEDLIVFYLKNKISARALEISKATGIRNPLTSIHNLIKMNMIEVDEKLSGIYKPKLESFITLHTSFKNKEILNEVLDKLNRAPKQKSTLESFIFLSEETGEIKKTSLLKDQPTSPPALTSLLKKGILVQSFKQVDRLSTEQKEIQKVKTLSPAQKEAMVKVKSLFGKYNTVLLHGVTSSGKTEIYAHLIKEQLKNNKQVLYLLPEIAITSQIIERLRRYFGNKVGVYHSKYSDSERVEVWNKLVSRPSDKSYQIILGVRSSIFLPFNNLGLVIIDEEQENTYKQQDPAPRYHARDAAIYLASLHKAKTLIGTATPSIESYFNTKIKKYGLVELHERHGKIKLPEIKLANTREAWRKRKMVSHFTPELYKAISEALEANEQVILFQNRRGFSPYIQCDKCSWVPLCKNCDVNLTYHKYSHSLTCHYCGYSISLPGNCPECGAAEVRTKGFGTEKIEEETKLVFPEAKIGRMDLDTTRRKRSYQTIISDFETNKIDILIGTQMISKGLDFSNVRLVGVLNADNLLFFPDFRAYEKTFQLLAQVSGRAGRKRKQGKVIIQTSDPDHPVLHWVVQGDYLKMFRTQIDEREAFKYPPFYKLIKITLKHKNLEILNKAGNKIGKELRVIFGNRVLGPEFPQISKIQLFHLKTILLKFERGNNYIKLKNALLDVILKLEKSRDFTQLKIVIDVDPY